MFHENFKTSLEDAKNLFISSRRDALDAVYNHRLWARKRSPEVDASYEEVAASCGHFGSCLEDLSEDTISYLEILQELKELTEHPDQRTWKWLRFWVRKSPVPHRDQGKARTASTMLVTNSKQSKIYSRSL
jgi:hypothetical protein